MKYLLVLNLMLVLTLSACTAREYHLSQLSNSMTSGNQRRHLRAIQSERDITPNRNPDGSCPHYSQGYGGFTVSCY